MPEVEHFLDFRADKPASANTAQQAHWQFIIDFVAEDGTALTVAEDDVSVFPLMEWARFLDIDEHVWRVVECVLGDPSQLEWSDVIHQDHLSAGLQG